MWIVDRRGDAVKTDCLVSLSWDEGMTEEAPFIVVAETADENRILRQFATKEEAKAYIADLVQKMNYNEEL